MQILKEYKMATDGIQAEGAIVLRHNPESWPPFVVHFRNDQDGGHYHGDYRETLAEAEEAFELKCKRYDPTGELHREHLELAILRSF